MYAPMSEIRLTETTRKGGCAAKLPAGQLREILSKITLNRPKELLVGTETLDDAALWDLGNDQLLIQTLDFFTPIVDDPRDFGRIAAANALSDVYAMGGRPITALTILAFPCSALPMELIDPLMAGAIEKINESGASLAGGHSIDDESLKLGFSVSGLVQRTKAWTNAGAQAGDVLILTKALGTGTITSRAKKREAKEEWVQAAIESMCLLNRAPELLTDFRIHAATDITGFGLAGHAMQMAEASNKTFAINTEAIPSLPGALESLEAECLNRAHHTNSAYVKQNIEYASEVKPARRWLTVDPQTSGGLLLSVPKNQTSGILAALQERFARATVIGTVAEPTGTRVNFVSNARQLIFESENVL